MRRIRFSWSLVFAGVLSGGWVTGCVHELRGASELVKTVQGAGSPRALQAVSVDGMRAHDAQALAKDGAPQQGQVGSGFDWVMAGRGAVDPWDMVEVIAF